MASTILSIFGLSKFVTEHTEDRNPSWQPYFHTFSNGIISTYQSEDCLEASSVYTSRGESFTREEEDVGECLVLPVYSGSKLDGTLFIRMDRLEAEIWVAAAKRRRRSVAVPVTFFTTNRVGEDDNQHMISILIDGTEYSLPIPAGSAAAEDAAVRFVESLGLSTDYAPAVEMELLRARLQLLEGAQGQWNQMRAVYLAKQVELAECTGRLEQAEGHAARLAGSLCTLQSLLPLVLPDMGESPSSNGTGEDVLREVCFRRGVSAGDAGAGHLTLDQWLTLDREERAELGAACNDTESTIASQSGAGHLSWQSRYWQLRSVAAQVAREKAAIEAALTSARSDLRKASVGTNPALENALLENQGLREQTVRLRGEILRLRDSIAEVKAAAAQAMHSVSAFGKDVARLPLIEESPLAAVAEAEAAGDTVMRVAESSVNDGRSGRKTIAVSARRAEAEEQQHRLQLQQQGLHETPPAAGTGAGHSHWGSQGLQQTRVVSQDEVSPLREEYTPELLRSEPRHRHSAGSQHDAEHPPPPPSAVYEGEGPTSTESALELALRAAHVPIVCDRILRLLFDRFNSQDGKFLMNSFRYLRCLKECGVTANEDEVAQHNTRWLSYGVVSIVFNEALKVKTEDSSVAVGSGAASAQAPNSYVRNTSTVLTLKGAAESRASALSHQQFLGALRSLALRLYADVIEEEFGVLVELLKDPVKETAAYQALELMVQDKIVPVAVRQDFMPWPLVHLERTLFALQQIPRAFAALALPQHCDDLARWFTHYAVTAGDATGTSGAARSLPALTLTVRRPLSAEDTAVAALTYKALSRFAHDFGVVPYLLKEPELFGLFQELMVWMGAGLHVSADALPPSVLAALNASLNRTVSPDRFAAMPRAKATVERISFSAFAVAVCIFAMQGFPEEPDGARLGRLLEWLQRGGGPSLVARRQ